jgi:hypothetical protein
MKLIAVVLLVLLIELTPSHAQVSPRRELPPQQPSLQPSVPPRNSNFTNSAQRRSFPTNSVTRLTTNGVRTTLPPGMQTNSLSTTNRAPTGFSGTNTLRQAPLGTNLGTSRLPLSPAGSTTNLSSTNGVTVTNGLRISRPITPAQRAQIARLTADLNSLRLASQIMPAQKEQLLNGLRASALGTRKPAEAALNQLVDHLLTVWPTQGFTVQQKAQLAIDLNRILNAGDLSPPDTQLVINDARRIFQASGMSSQAVETLTRDLSLIAVQAQGTFQPERAADAPAKGEASKKASE